MPAHETPDDRRAAPAADLSPVEKAVAASWFLVCLCVFLSHRPIPFGTDRFTPLPSPAILTPHFLTRTAGLVLRLALFWTAAWRLGRWLMPALRAPATSRLEGFLLSLGLGAGALGLTALGLGMCGLLRPRLLMILLAGAAAAAIPHILRFLRDRGARSGLVELARELRPRGLWPAALLSGLILYQFLIALGPTLFYDSLVYHLALPDLYLLHGAIVATPLNAYAGIPAGIEMLYAWLLPWGGLGSTCQLLHLSLGVLTAAAIAVAGRRLGSLAAGMWGAAIFFSNPMVLLSSGRPTVELGWSFYLALALLCVLLYRDGADERWLAPTGLLAGLALGSKYQAVVLLPALFVLFALRGQSRRGWSLALKVCAIAVVAAAPWGLRNIALYRNPVFPFLGGSFFPSNSVDLPAFVASAHGRNLTETLKTWGGFRDFIAHPWTYSFPYEGSEADNALSFLYLAALPLLFIRPPSSAGRRLLLFAAVLWIPLNALSGIARFSIPALAPASLAFGLLLVDLPGTAFAAAQAAAGSILVLNGLFAHSKTNFPHWRELSGEIPEAVYLSHSLSGYFYPPYAAFAWANAHLPPDAKVLLVGEPRVYYLERDAQTSSPYASSPAAEYANASSSGDELYRRLRDAGITHVLINIQAMSSFRETLKMSEQGLASFTAFWEGSLAAVYVDQNMNSYDRRFTVVYRLLTPDERARPHKNVDLPFEGRAVGSR